MNEAARNLIADLFSRVRSTETAYRDPEAEAFINDQVARQPHAPYAMAQTLVVQDQSLQAAQARISELERQLADGRGGGSFAPGAGGSSPWGPRANEAMGAPSSFGQGGARYEDRQQGYPPPPPPPPPGYQQQPQGGGGFLSGALQTAAGVAGGALLFEGVRHLFGGGGDEARAGGLGDVSKLGDAASGGADSQTGGWFDGLLDGVGSPSDRTPDAGADDNDFDGGGDGGDWT